MAQDSFEMNPTQLTALENASMPQDSDAEFSILSAMILSEEIRGECLIRLSSEDFYIPSNQIIFEAIKSLFDNNKPVDVISLADHLKSNGKFERAGGAVRLAELGNNPLAMVGWENHAVMLHRDTTLRKMISASAKISALAYNAPEDTKEVVDQAEKLIFDVTNRDVQQSEQGIEDIMTDLFEELQQNAGKDASELGVQTGFATLDNLFQGLRPGQMVVIGARPGVGKTSFALSMAYNAAVSGATVALFSLEMSKIEIAQRLLASESKVDLQTIRSSNIRNEQWPT
ncbi:MAG: AAA family ATPase, partial [Atopobium sp.]|nr:AAA family ATPase [Atopobium sp.]